MKVFDHKDLRNHLLQLCPKVVKHPVYTGCFTTCRQYCRGWFPRSLLSKSSHKHVSDFGRLRSYGHFVIPVHALMWTTLRSQLAGDVLNLLAYRLRCKHYFCQQQRCRVSPVRFLISVRMLRSRCHLRFQLQSMQIWFMSTVFVTVIQLMT